MKEFLLLQVRPEDKPADQEYQHFLQAGGLDHSQLVRFRVDQQPLPEINFDNYSGIIIGGTSYNVSDPESKKTDTQRRVEGELRPIMDQIIDRDFPFFGACYGLGILATQLEAGVVSKDRYGEESGAAIIEPVWPVAKEDPIMNTSPDSFKGFVGHKEAVQKLPDGAVHLASSETCPIQMIRVGSNVYASQFHPELDSHGLESRIWDYMDYGYFDPNEAQNIVDSIHQEIVIEPERIFQSFIKRHYAEG